MNALVIKGVSHRYGKLLALDDISLSAAAGETIGLIGPDGVGKSTLLALLAGVKRIQSGQIQLFGTDLSREQQRLELSRRVAYMAQGLGRNLYPTLSVQDNVDFHGRLFGLNGRARRQRIQRLLDATGLGPFATRPAGKLSGGMKQKCSLCCALVHNPDILILDEPTTGVDPLSRRQFWQLVDELRRENPAMTVLVATAYIEEAQRFQRCLAMDAGRLLVDENTAALLARFNTDRLEEAYIKLLPEEKQSTGVVVEPYVADAAAAPVIIATGLSKDFGNFKAVDNVSFTINSGEIFGFLGSNGCGKSTTMKMMTGLLTPSAGTVTLFGKELGEASAAARLQVGYMSQSFSLYEEMTVAQNLLLHADLYQLPGDRRQAVRQALGEFDLANYGGVLARDLPLGLKQRLQLAAACLHRPPLLILDEPTSGVDVAARDLFWRHLLRLSRRERVTIFITTHFMNEAERCDRISFMHRGRVLAQGSPAQLLEQSQRPNLEEAFISYLEQAQPELAPSAADQTAPERTEAAPVAQAAGRIPAMLALDPKLVERDKSERGLLSQPFLAPLRLRLSRVFRRRPAEHRSGGGGFFAWWHLMFSFAAREWKELLRDRVRVFFALAGPVVLMFALGYGVNFDVKDMDFTVLDRDQSAASRDLVSYFSHSPYFRERPPAQSDAEEEALMRRAQTLLTIDIPPGYGAQLARGQRPELAFFIDGAQTFSASTASGYVANLLNRYGQSLAAAPATVPPARLVPRFRYNQDFASVNSVVPGVLMMALMMFPAILTAIAVAREREIGSISNFIASPADKLQFLLGKQLSYVLLSWGAFLLLLGLMAFLFHLPLKGSLAALLLGTLLMLLASTAFGLFISCFTRSQVGAIVTTAVASIVPMMSFSGFIFPTSGLAGGAFYISKIIAPTYYLRISRGTFTKALDFAQLTGEMLALAAIYLAFMALAWLILRRQER